MGHVFKGFAALLGTLWPVIGAAHLRSWFHSSSGPQGGPRFWDQLKADQFWEGAPVPTQALSWSEIPVWKQAALEEGINPRDVSEFGQRVGKVPRSWVQAVQGMGSSKRHTFNFMGAALTRNVRGTRAWIFPFMEKHFSDNDILRITDAPSNWTALGKYDNTGARLGYNPRLDGYKYRAKFNTEYFKVLAESNFTLCPGGDAPFSIRFYESILAGSIPVLHSMAHDMSRKRNSTQEGPLLLPCIGYHSATVNGPFEYSQASSDKNFQLFLKYQTFIEGDNVPDKCKDKLADWHRRE